MPLPLIQKAPEEGFWNERAGDYLETDTYDKLEADFELAARSTAVPQIATLLRANELEDAPDQRTLSVEELIKKYPGVTWTEPKKEAVAYFIAGEDNKRRKLEGRSAQGPDNKLTATLGFGANLAAHLLDPAEMAVNLAGGAVLRGAGYFTAKTLGTAASRGVVEGVATGVLTEGVNIAAQRELQQDITLQDSLVNVGFGALAGGVFEGIGHGIGKLRERMDRSSAAQMLNGRFPDPEPIKTVWDRERLAPNRNTAVPDFSGRVAYEFTPVELTAPVSRKVYAGTSSLADDAKLVAPGANQNSTINFGGARVVVDDALVANGHAASSFNEAPGVIHEFDMNGAKVLSIDEALPPATAKNVADILSELADSADMPSLKEMAEAILRGEAIPGKAIFKALEDAPEGAADALTAALKAEGYDALHFTDGTADGASKHNGFVVLNDERMVQTGSFEPERGLVPGLSEKEIAAIRASNNLPENQLGYDPEAQRAIDISEQNLENDLAATVEELSGAQAQELKALEESGVLKESHVAELKEIDEAAAKNGEVGAGIVSFLSTCIGRA